MEGLHPEATLLDLLEMKPQMWACHSIGFEWGQLPMISFSRIEPETGQFLTEVTALPHKKSEMPSYEVLEIIGEEIREKVFQDINDTIAEMQKIEGGEIGTKTFTSTFIALDWARWDCCRDTEEEE